MTLSGKVNVSVERIRMFDPLATGLMDEPYYVAYSGGKDSDALRILFELAGVRYDLWHNHTTADAPETVRYVRTIPNINISYPAESMWQLIVNRRMPPTRMMRYCCEVLKERGGQGRFVATGVRWAESVRRSNTRGLVEVQHRERDKSLILNSDNDESRRMFETCQIKGKRVINPIIDWSDDDVWEFLRAEGCASNPLYECGFKRVGCIGCPMAGRTRILDFQRWPKYYDIYLHTFDRMLRAREEANMASTQWKTGQDVMDWWLEDAYEAYESHERMKLRMSSRVGEVHGIYTIVEEMPDKDAQNHRVYKATCSVCGAEKIAAYSEFVGNRTAMECQHVALGTGESIARTEWKSLRLRKTFTDIKQRCYNEKNKQYNNYGALGIRVCDEWLRDPSAFQNWAYDSGYTEQTRLRLKDKEKGYSPDNCMWK